MPDELNYKEQIVYAISKALPTLDAYFVMACIETCATQFTPEQLHTFAKEYGEVSRRRLIDFKDNK